MNQQQQELFDAIVKRWHAESWRGLTVEQAALDIGVLSGIITQLDRKPWEGV